ncbi:MAG: helix-turn-helix transcriptional regulator [Candidatus Diapherotrites archaeon]|nr:helix-turn-helix transcriptional regulator [Candidatus Diapherotrites archaeon]
MDFDLSLDDAFDLAPEYEHVFREAIKQKLEKGERVNVFFSTNFFNFNYYYLTQFVFLSTLAKSPNVYFYIALADTVLFAKKHVHFSSPMASRETGVIQTNLEVIRDILASLGVREQNVFVFKSSEAWIKFIKLDDQNIVEFYKALSLFPNSAFNIPKWWVERYYVPKNTKFSLAYAVQKYLDLFACKFFPQIYPEEIEGKIDVFVSGNAGSRLLLVAKDTLIQEGTLSKDLPILVMKGVPCFGHTQLVNKKFCMPSIDMSVQEIYSVIRQYNVSSKHIKELFDNLLSKVLSEFIVFEYGKVLPSKKQPNLEKHSIKDQRFLLAYNLEAYLKKLKSQLQDKQSAKYYSANKPENILRISKLLGSKFVLDVLNLSNGNNSITEISRKLGKHTSNVSAIISKLREEGLVQINKEGRPVRTLNTVKINF